jgi:hypothetical protein
VSQVTNINIVNINNFAHNHNFNHIRNGLPPQAVFNRHPFIWDAIPASVREGGRLNAQKVANPASVGRQLANPGVVKPPANVPKLSQEIPKGVAPGAQPAASGGAKGVPVAPRGATAPKAVATPGGGTAPEVMTAPGRQPRAPRAATVETTPRAGTAPRRGTTMPPSSTHEVTPQMQRQIRQAPSRPAPVPRMAPSAPAPRMAPSAPAPRSAPAPAPRSAPAPAPRSAPSAPAGGGGGGIQGGGHR